MLLTFSVLGLLQAQPSQLGMDYPSLAFCSPTNLLTIPITSVQKEEMRTESQSHPFGRRDQLYICLEKM